MNLPLNLILVLLALTIDSYVFSQEVLKYHVVKGGQSVGYMQTTRHRQGTYTRYTLDYQLEIRFLIKISLSFAFECKYKNNRLISASSRMSRDGKLREVSNIYWNGSQYYLTQNGKTRSIEDPIQNYSTIIMHFHEPKGRNRIFSERFGQLLSIKALEDKYYEMTLASGNKNYYTYKNGVCDLMTITHPMGNISFKRISD